MRADDDAPALAGDRGAGEPTSCRQGTTRASALDLDRLARELARRPDWSRRVEALGLADMGSSGAGHTKVEDGRLYVLDIARGLRQDSGSGVLD